MLIASVALAAVPAQAGETEKKPALIDVLLPADAELEVDGYKAKAMGETRRFETPPVELGFTYAYTVKATWRGHTIERKIRMRAGETIVVDLRQELQTAATPPPVGSFGLLVPPARTAVPKVEPKPEIKPAAALVSKPKHEPDTKVEAKPKSKPAAVLASKPAVLRKPMIPTAPPTPVSAPVLRVASPDNVVLRPGQTKYLEIKVTMKNGEPLPAEPVVMLASSPDDKLTCSAWTASDFKSKPAAYTRGFAVKSAADASEGEHKVKVLVTAGAEKAELALKVTVQLPR